MVWQAKFTQTQGKSWWRGQENTGKDNHHHYPTSPCSLLRTKGSAQTWMGQHSKDRTWFCQLPTMPPTKVNSALRARYLLSISWEGQYCLLASPRDMLKMFRVRKMLMTDTTPNPLYTCMGICFSLQRRLYKGLHYKQICAVSAHFGCVNIPA